MPSLSDSKSKLSPNMASTNIIWADRLMPFKTNGVKRKIQHIAFSEIFGSTSPGRGILPRILGVLFGSVVVYLPDSTPPRMTNDHAVLTGVTGCGITMRAVRFIYIYLELYN
jgi:hypothetical protein